VSRVPTFLQSEAADCGLTCLAMVRSALGCWTDTAELRTQYGGSLRGSALKDLMRVAEATGLLPRAVTCDLPHLQQLATPCILHWDFNHFVVLEKVRRRSIDIVDPAIGRRRLRLADASAHFTGVALEVRRGPDLPAMKPPRTGWAVLGLTHGWRPAVWQLLGVSAALEVFALAAPLFTQVALDDVVTASDADLLVLVVIAFGLMLIAQEAIGAMRGMMIGRIGREMKLQWASSLFQHVARLPLATLENRTLGELLTRFRSLEHLQRLVATSAVEAVMDGLMCAALFAVMAAYSPKLCAIVAAASAAYIALRGASQHWFRENTARRLMLTAREQGFLVETFRAMQPIKMFGGESRRFRRWQEIHGPLADIEMQEHRGQVLMRHAGRLLAGVENLAVLGCGVMLVLNTHAHAPFTAGMLMAFLAYRSQFSARLTAFADFLADSRLLKLHDDRLAELLSLRREPPSHPGAGCFDAPTPQPTIELRDVGFRYGASGPWVFRHCSLRVVPGEHLALVGPSGGGKTTLLKVILGLLDPVEGDVLVDGKPVAHFGPKRFRALFGPVMQDDTLLSGSVAENIAFDSDSPDMHRVESCAKLAQVHDDIAALPMGYRSLVGDLGTSFSGGQRQRIMIARALYTQPRILAFDEATSHLDAATEIMVEQALGKLALTRISVAHRAETIRRADRAFTVAGAMCQEVDLPNLRRAAA
jgi:ATP-binding cassette subfamily B protein RaxB